MSDTHEDIERMNKYKSYKVKVRVVLEGYVSVDVPRYCTDGEDICEEIDDYLGNLSDKELLDEIEDYSIDDCDSLEYEEER